ncbi:hypothetical protein QJS66_20095 [Kocuria rhizophila]|nr:hypothetical protein QJS66_20095 [Kocuria rhizophila]
MPEYRSGTRLLRARRTTAAMSAWDMAARGRELATHTSAELAKLKPTADPAVSGTAGPCPRPCCWGIHERCPPGLDAGVAAHYGDPSRAAGPSPRTSRGEPGPARRRDRGAGRLSWLAHAAPPGADLPGTRPQARRALSWRAGRVECAPHVMERWRHHVAHRRGRGRPAGLTELADLHAFAWVERAGVSCAIGGCAGGRAGPLRADSALLPGPLGPRRGPPAWRLPWPGSPSAVRR